MPEIHKLLVPVDFSACSRPALDEAATLAARVAAEVHVLHVWEIPQFVPPGARLGGLGARGQSLTSLLESRASEILRAFVAEARGRGITVASAFAEPGLPSSTIVEIARRGRYDLVVMGTHGRTGFAHALLGSVTEKVVRRSSCPVLTVREATPQQRTKTGRILVPVDYSECSRAALEHAAVIARALEATLEVVHVWDRPSFVAGDVMVCGQDGGRRSLGDLIRESSESEMLAFLAAFRQADEQAARILQGHRLLSGDPATTLIAELERGDHDLVVLGTQGRTGLKHLLLGSVAEKLVRLSPVPVLTVPPRRPNGSEPIR